MRDGDVAADVRAMTSRDAGMGPDDSMKAEHGAESNGVAATKADVGEG
jgi:hypothetical protein